MFYAMAVTGKITTVQLIANFQKCFAATLNIQMKSGCCESESILSQILLLDVLLLRLLMRFHLIAKNESSNMQLFVWGFILS